MIYTVTLNPAMDKVLFVDSFEKNVTTRIKKTLDTLGGKGVHISYDLNIMGVKSVATGIIFGKTGRGIKSIVRSEGIKTLFLEDEKERGNSRTNLVIREDDGSSTIIAEKGVRLTREEIRNFKDMLKSKIKDGDTLVISGDASNAPPSINNEIINCLKEKNLKIIIDASGSTLKSSIKAKPFLVKPNKDELESVCGKKIKSESDVIAGIKKLNKAGAQNIAVSLGGKGSISLIAGELFKATVPKVKVESTVGCGDCFLSGIIYGFEKALPSAEMLRYASAVSAAAAMHVLSVGFDEKKAEALKRKVKVQRI